MQEWQSPRANSACRSSGFLRLSRPSYNLGVWASVFEKTGGFKEDYPQSHDVEWSWRAQLVSFTLGFAEGAVVHYRYRTSVRGVSRQAYLTGSTPRRLYRDYRSQGLERAPRSHASLRTWAWLPTHVHYLLSPPRRGHLDPARGRSLRTPGGKRAIRRDLPDDEDAEPPTPVSPALIKASRYFRDQSGKLAALGLLSFVSGYFQASTFVLIVPLATTISSEKHHFSRKLGPIKISASTARSHCLPRSSIVAAALLDTVVRVVPGEMVAQWELRRREEVIDEYLRAEYPIQAAERLGTLTTLLGYATGGSVALGAIVDALEAALTIVIFVAGADPHRLPGRALPDSRPLIVLSVMLRPVMNRRTRLQQTALGDVGRLQPGSHRDDAAWRATCACFDAHRPGGQAD